MEYRNMLVPRVTIGLDLGDKRSHLFALKHDGEILEDCRLPTTKAAFEKHFGESPAARVVIEAGTHSHWVNELLSGLGHEVVVANPAALGPKRRGRRKNDRLDAAGLAFQGQSNPRELHPIRHRSIDSQVELSVIRARDTMVRSRTQNICAARSIIKTFGERLPAGGHSETFAKRVRPLVPEQLKPVIGPLLDVIEMLTLQIKKLEKYIEQRAREKYPWVARLTQVKGVATLTALAYVLTVEDPKRFEKSRTVGAYVGLVPALFASGDDDPELKISRAGNSYLRRLLVNASQYILGPFGEDCDLRRHGLKIAQRGRKNAKKRAVIAVARKLAVLLHRLWSSGATYDPLYNAKKKQKQNDSAA